jgi:hypothetical protein
MISNVMILYINIFSNAINIIAFQIWSTHLYNLLKLYLLKNVFIPKNIDIKEKFESLL